MIERAVQRMPRRGALVEEEEEVTSTHPMSADSGWRGINSGRFPEPSCPPRGMPGV